MRTTGLKRIEVSPPPTWETDPDDPEAHVTVTVQTRVLFPLVQAQIKKLAKVCLSPDLSAFGFGNPVRGE